MTDAALVTVREWFAAFNRSDADRLAGFYREDAELDRDEGVIRGRDAIRAAYRAHFASCAPALDDGARRRVRTMGKTEGGVSVEWIGAERMLDGDAASQASGYGHFAIEDGAIARQREVIRPAEPPREADQGRPPSTRRYPERPVVGVGAVIVERGRVVLIKRRFEPLAGQWSLPGGTLELGETLEAGVAREALEETGLEVEVCHVLDVFDRILLDPEARVRYHFVLIDYYCRPIGGELRAGSDVADAVWADAASIASYRMTPKAVAIVDRALGRTERPAGEALR